MDDDRLKLEIKHAFILTQERTLRRLYDWERGEAVLELHHDIWSKSASAPPGTGIRVFAGAVKGAIALGVDRITTNAFGNYARLSADRTRAGGWNGYYTWPLFGFNAPLPSDYRVELPPELSEAESLLDLYELPGGAAWWKQHGGSINVVFDLRPGSRSLQTLQDYLAAKGIKW